MLGVLGHFYFSFVILCGGVLFVPPHLMYHQTYSLNSNDTNMVSNISEVDYISYNQVSIMTSQLRQDDVISFKMSAILDPASWISNIFQISQNS